ncbi:hypothetical protein [Streptomyces sp. NPDC048196]|uniref:MmyB family transcriptional regulator n=1 Tax=Streptomyces sp. NPDC048196 TaxID=3154712 RepID=UPI0033C9186A
MDQLLSTDPEIARTPGTYGRLERGSLDNPAPEYLRAVARILRFTSRGWESLYSFARGEMPPFPLWDDAEIEFEPFLPCATGEGLSFVCDLAGNILTFNAAFAQIFPGQRVPMNWYHYVLFDEYARTVLCPDWWETWAPRTMTALRGARARHRHNDLLQAMALRCSQDPAMRSLFATAAPAPDVDERVLVHHALGPGIVQLGEPLRSPGAHISQHNWAFRAAGGPRVRLTAVGQRGEEELGEFFPALGAEADAMGLMVLDD